VVFRFERTPAITGSSWLLRRGSAGFGGHFLIVFTFDHGVVFPVGTIRFGFLGKAQTRRCAGASFYTKLTKTIFSSSKGRGFLIFPAVTERSEVATSVPVSAPISKEQIQRILVKGRRLPVLDD